MASGRLQQRMLALAQRFSSPNDLACHAHSVHDGGLATRRTWMQAWLECLGTLYICAANIIVQFFFDGIIVRIGTAS